MKTKVFNKTKLVAIIISLIFILTSLSGLSLLFDSSKVVFASMEPVEVTVSNSNFNNNTVTGDAVAPSNWIKQNENSGVISGIISLEQSIIQEKMSESYMLSFVPRQYSGMKDKQVLMINGQNMAYSGYQSESFKLLAGSFYKITFMAMTENSNGTYAIGSASLSGTGFETLTERTIQISTNQTWKQYTFLVETNALSDVSTRISFWLGFENGVKSMGAVFFDNLEIYQIGEDVYRDYAKNLATNRYASICSLNKDTMSTSILNADFETYYATENTNGTGWEIVKPEDAVLSNENYLGLAYINDSFYANIESYKLTENNYPNNAYIENNNRALLINNKVSGAVGVKSQEIVLKQHLSYRISILVKSQIINGSAYLIIRENSPYPENNNFETKKFQLSIGSTASNTKNGDWVEYNIYLQGRSFEDTTFNLELWLGNEDSTAKGYVFFDQIKMYQISSTTYETGVAKQNKLEANFGSSTELTIKNGYFNNVAQQDLTREYPFDAKDWSYSTRNENNVVTGIINTNNLSSDLLALFNNPTSGSVYSNKNNVLLLGSLGINAIKYKSSSFDLKANKYYKLTFMVQTQELTNGAKAGFKLYSDLMTLKELMYVESDDAWTTYTLLIKTGNVDTNVCVELSLGEKNNGTGFAFFDNVALNETTENVYNSTLGDRDYRVNLASEDFTNTSSKSVNGIYTSNSYEAANGSDVSSSAIKAGIVDITDTDVFTNYLVGITNPGMHQGGFGNALMISSQEPCYYYYTSLQTFKLEKDNYYKVSVWINAKITNQTTESEKLGATITLTNIDKTFSQIDTNGEWKQYIFYINCTSSSDINVKLSLGENEKLTSGDIFFSNVNIEKIEQDNYYSSVQVLENDSSIDNIMAVGSTTKEEEKQEETAQNDGINFNWLVIPTLITAIAIIVAVVGVIVRNYNKNHKKPVKVKVGEYERSRSLEKDFEHREAIRRQREKLERLQRQLQDVRFEIAGARQEFNEEARVHNKELREKLRKENERINQEHSIKLKQIAERIRQAKAFDGNQEDKQIKLEEYKKQQLEIKQKKLEEKQKLQAYKVEQNRLFRERQAEAYKLRQSALQAKYDAIQLEIEAIYQEELRLIQAYKEYKKQVKLAKQQLRLEKKNARKK